MKINEKDNVDIDLENAHKYAVCDIKQNEKVIKFGYPIGYAVTDIKKGDHIHSHNLKTLLSGTLEYKYNKKEYVLPSSGESRYFYGYLRENGEAAIRNEIWIINTVGCVNNVAKQIADKTGAFSFPHPYGCSQLGDDMETTAKILAGLVRHPNAAGVLILGLGCENTNIEYFKKYITDVDPAKLRFLNTQDSDDEIAEGIKLVNELKAYAQRYTRVKLPISKLKIGLKCGGSDGYSGITANPLVGRVSDMLISYGGSSVLTEVPEMFGAEHLLMERCKNETVFNKTVSLINDFKDYYSRHGQVIYENPSPGNKAGGITTLEEKSLGCVQKGGFSEVTDVLDYGDTVKTPGLSLLNGPGNDMVAITNLASAGVHMILFTTGRGTPLGAPVPTVKISTNSKLFEKKKNWIDFDAGGIIEGKDLDEALLDLMLDTANGKETKSEIGGFREISIFKDGVTL